jgi:FkbM family methyltransferase
MKVYFDVGANTGESMMRYAGDDAVVYAFEPTPELVRILVGQSAGLKNYHVIDKAVADYNGKSTFFISGNQDWGCSSLNTFSDNLEVTWPGRTDFKVTDQVEVDVIRLDGFIEANDIQEIEFFHCDTQGKDMEVLFGMGEHLRKIKRGVIEMATRHDTKLYKDQKYIVDDAIIFLKNNGFRVDGVVSNDWCNNEVNIEFSRIDMMPMDKLRVAVVFSGRATCYDESYEWFNTFSDKYAVDFYCSISTELDEHYQRFVDLYGIKKYKFENMPLGIVFTNDNHRNRLLMFYNLKSVVDMVPLGDYDVILYARADIVCSEDIDLSLAVHEQDRDNVVFIPSNNDHGGVNDQMAFGTPTAMFKYSRVFDNLGECKRSDDLADVHPESTLKAHLDSSGLRVRRFDLNYSLNPGRYAYELNKASN